MFYVDQTSINSYFQHLKYLRKYPFSWVNFWVYTYKDITVYTQYVSRLNKVIDSILKGTSDENISFMDLQYLLKNLHFEERIRGDHHIYTRTDITDIINIQPKGSKAKAYQVKQVRNIILKYKLWR